VKEKINKKYEQINGKELIEPTRNRWKMYWFLVQFKGCGITYKQVEGYFIFITQNGDNKRTLEIFKACSFKKTENTLQC
jgi:hypothetical protein